MDDKATSEIALTFSTTSVYSFFSKVYSSSPHHFTNPPWMPVLPPPGSSYVMEMTPVSEEELARVLKKSKPSSTPSPFDHQKICHP